MYQKRQKSLMFVDRECFGEEISQIMSALPPLNIKLTLPDPVSNPMVPVRNLI